MKIVVCPLKPYKTATGRQCSKCNYTMTLPANNGKGGRGKECPNCKKLQVFNMQCRGCGAKFSNG